MKLGSTEVGSLGVGGDIEGECDQNVFHDILKI